MRPLEKKPVETAKRVDGVTVEEKEEEEEMNIEEEAEEEI